MRMVNRGICSFIEGVLREMQEQEDLFWNGSCGSVLDESQKDHLIAWAERRFPNNTYAQNARIAQGIIDRRMKKGDQQEGVGFPPESGLFPDLKRFFDLSARHSAETKRLSDLEDGKLDIDDGSEESRRMRVCREKADELAKKVGESKPSAMRSLTEAIGRHGIDFEVHDVCVMKRKVRGMGFFLCIDRSYSRCVFVRQDGIILDMATYDFTTDVILRRWSRFLAGFGTKDVTNAW